MLKTILHDHNYNCNILTYGLNEGILMAKNINYNELGCATFDVYKEGHHAISNKS